MTRGQPAALVVLWLSMCAGFAAQPSRAPEAVVEGIVRLMAEGAWSDAGKAASDALARHPDDAALHNLAGAVDAERGHEASARAHFARAIALAPRAVAAYENLGRLLLARAGEDASVRAEALHTFERLLALDPAHVDARFHAALLHAVDGKFDGSEELLQGLPPAVRMTPQVLALAAVTAAARQPAAAAELAAGWAAHAEMSAADVVNLLPALEHLPASDPTRLALLEALDRRGLATPGALAILGRSYLAAQQPARARAVLERSAADRPSAPTLMDLGRAAALLGDRKRALGHLAHARSLSPNDYRTHFLFGVVCVEENLGAEAYDALQKAVALAPDDPHVNYVLGVVAMHRHEPAESLPYLRQFVALTAGDARGRFALGVALFQSHLWPEAEVELRAAALDSRTAPGARYFLARLSRQQNDTVAARREVDEALRLKPDYADAWAELGLLQTRAGEYAAAEASLGRALALTPDHYQATVHLAALFGRTRDPRRDAVTARLATLQVEREARAQDFLRIIEVVPPPAR